MQATAESGATGLPGARTHDIYLRENPASLVWHLTDRGIALAEDRLAWLSDGVRRERTFDDIAAIRLQLASAGRGASGLCRIFFRDGTQLHLYGTDQSGLPDDTQNARYTAFVRDLHRRLAADARPIAFEAGLPGGNYAVLTAAAIAGAALFVVLPVVLALLLRTMSVLLLCAGSIGFAWPFWRIWNAAKPRSYTPDALPEDVLP